MMRQEDGALGDYACVWLIDFARPANFRVTQVTGGKASHNDWDRWATISDEHYEWLACQLTGNPLPAGALNRSQTNQFLTLDKWLSLLTRSHPASVSLYQASGRRYVLLEYEASDPSGVLIDEVSPEVSGYREAFSAWIDEDTGRLVKGVLEATVRLRAGQELPIQLQQVFAGYDHDMRFDSSLPFPELGSREPGSWPEGSRARDLVTAELATAGTFLCPQCSSPYNVADYPTDRPSIYCAVCGAPLPPDRVG